MFNLLCLTWSWKGSHQNIIATEATLVLKSSDGIGSGEFGALDIQVAGIDITNTDSGDIFISEKDILRIENISQSSDGNIHITSLEGNLVVNSIDDSPAIKSTTGQINLISKGVENSGISIQDAIHTTGGGLSIITELGDIVLSDDILVTGTGNIELDAKLGKVINDTDSVNWLMKDGSFSDAIDWALK